MKKNVILFFVLFIISMGTCYAQWTVIRTYDGDSVQCNNWGWVEGNFQTAWPNTCTPLSVKNLETSEVLTVSTTENACQENELALYTYSHGDDAIKFVACFSMLKTELKKNIHR